MKYTADISKKLTDKMEALCERTGTRTTDFLEEAIASQLEVEAARYLPEEEEVEYGKVMRAARVMLESKGYRVLEEEYDVADIVALDEDGTLVFVAVRGKRNDMPDESLISRKELELCAMRYCAENEFDELGKVRFDSLCFAINDQDRALARHHIGFFNEAA